MLSPITERQFARLKTRFPNASCELLASGAALVTVPEFLIPGGWNQSKTDIRFVVPAGYPGPFPDCFWATTGLRLADGRLPTNAQDDNPIPETSLVCFWFSWHITDAAQNWDPNRDDLSTYVSIIATRFEKLQ